VAIALHVGVALLLALASLAGSRAAAVALLGEALALWWLTVRASPRPVPQRAFPPVRRAGD
jgi:hypothetical protein